MQFQRPGKASPGINIAPLVDVIFLLVIFFAVSTTFLETAGLDLELPQSTSTAQRDSKEITVFLASDGTLMLGDDAVDRDQIVGLLREQLEQAENKEVALRADAKTSHGQVVEVMDLIREAGAEGLRVAAKAGAGDR